MRVKNWTPPPQKKKTKTYKALKIYMNSTNNNNLPLPPPHTHTCMHARTYACTRKHAHIHAHTHTHTHRYIDIYNNRYYLVFWSFWTIDLVHFLWKQKTENRNRLKLLWRPEGCRLLSLFLINWHNQTAVAIFCYLICSVFLKDPYFRIFCSHVKIRMGGR